MEWTSVLVPTPLVGGGIFDPHTHRRLSGVLNVNVSEGATQLALLCSCFVLVCSEGGAGRGSRFAFGEPHHPSHNIAVGEEHSFVPQLNGQTAPLGGNCYHITLGTCIEFSAKSPAFPSPSHITHGHRSCGVS